MRLLYLISHLRYNYTISQHFTLLLLGCLIGIAAGFHMAYMVADTDGPADWKPHGVIKRRSRKGPKPKRPRKTGRKENPFPSSAAMRPPRTIRIWSRRLWVARTTPTAISLTIHKHKKAGCAPIHQRAACFFSSYPALRQVKSMERRGRIYRIMVEYLL